MKSAATVLACTVAAWLGSSALPRFGYAADAFPLSPGNPVTAGTPTTFSGIGGTASSGGALTALVAFEAAIGGANNGGNPSVGANGFRTINWDGVTLNGADFGGNTIVIVAGKTVGIPRNRFESRGVFFEEIYAVSGDGFVTVNPGASGLFPAFSPSNTFAMFEDNTIGLSFVLPAAATSAPVAAASRGFGALFLNVRTPNTTSIEYFNGSASLGKFFVPASGTPGDPEFLGKLFGSPIVTNVQITCGTEALFDFDGSAASAVGTNSPPTHNLVVTDDFVYAEPTTVPNPVPGISATAGTAFTGVVAPFTDTDTAANAHAFTALIDWGDGHLSPGTIQANASGGFDVSGSNTYASAGTFAVAVDVQDFGGAEVTLDVAATVAATPTTTSTTTSTTLPCAGNSPDSVVCLLAEVPPPACAGQSLPGRIAKLAVAAGSLASRVRAAQGKKQRRLAAKLVNLLGRLVADVGESRGLTSSCPGALASLFADARTRIQTALAAL